MPDLVNEERKEITITLPDSSTISLEREEEKIDITNDRRLYRFIESGAAAVIVPRILLWFESVAESISAELGPAIELLTLILEITYQNAVHSWELVQSIALSIDGSATTNASITVVRDPFGE